MNHRIADPNLQIGCHARLSDGGTGARVRKRPGGFKTQGSCELAADDQMAPGVDLDGVGSFTFCIAGGTDK